MNLICIFFNTYEQRDQWVRERILFALLQSGGTMSSPNFIGTFYEQVNMNGPMGSRNKFYLHPFFLNKREWMDQ